jgi:hypothetical protein
MIVLLVKTPTRANPPDFSASSLANIVSAIINVFGEDVAGVYDCLVGENTNKG